MATNIKDKIAKLLAEPTATGAPVARRTRLAWWGWKRTSRLPSEL